MQTTNRSCLDRIIAFSRYDLRWQPGMQPDPKDFSLKNSEPRRAPSNFLGRSPVAMWTSLLRINTPTRRHVHSILNKIRCKRRKKKPTSTTYFTCAIFPGISCNFLIHFFFAPESCRKSWAKKVSRRQSPKIVAGAAREVSRSLFRGSIRTEEGL